MAWYDKFVDRLKGRSRNSPERQRVELDRASPISGGGVNKGKPRSETIDRVDPQDLEEYYYFEPIAFAGVNFYAHHVTGENFKIQGDNKQYVRDVENFLDNVSFKTKLNAIMRDLGIFGNAFMEIVWQKNKAKVRDLVQLDPKNVEFLKVGRAGNEEIAVDETGEPIGYIQTRSNGKVNKERYKEIASKFNNINEKDLKKERGVPFHRDEIVHFRLQNLSSSLMGVGLIEPVYPTITIKLNAEEALEEGMKRQSMPDIVGKAGSFDENEPVSASDTNKLKSSLEAMRQQDFGVVAVPEYYDIETLESDIGGQEEYFRMLQDLIIVGMGLPPGLLSRGADVGSSIAEIQHALTERVMSSFQKSLTRDCREQIFTVVLDEEDVSEVPDMVWKELNPLTRGKKIRRIGELARAGLITRDRELEDHLRELEDLPSLPEESEEDKKEREKKGKEKQDRAKSKSNRERI